MAVFTHHVPETGEAAEPVYVSRRVQGCHRHWNVVNVDDKRGCKCYLGTPDPVGEEGAHAGRQVEEAADARSEGQDG